MQQALRMLLLAVPLSCVSCAARDETAFAIALDELVVRLTFNGQEASFLFDTGAGAHTLARWFVDAAGITTDSVAGLRARDAVGELVELEAVHNASGLLANGRSLVLESAIVADFPPIFQEERVGGLLNPQLLAGEGQAVVLDLRVQEFRLQRFDDAVRLAGARILGPHELRVCREEDAPIANLAYAIAVTARDRTAWLQLDTGAGISSIRSGSGLVEGMRLEPGGEVMGVAGRSQGYLVAPSLPISFGGFDVSVDAQVVESNHGNCGPDGLLGRDALGGCALVLGQGSLAIGCSDNRVTG